MPKLRDQDKVKCSTKDTKEEWLARRENNKNKKYDVFCKWSIILRKKRDSMVEYKNASKVILQRSH